ncbi:MAG: UDP-glucose 4-epimerase [Betaproteobacteria bacterium]
MQRVLVTGGAGYIGSHACVEFIAGGHDVVVVDNLSNSHREAIVRVGRLVGRDVPFVQLDLRDRAGLEAVFARYRPTGVVHFAGLKAVGESVAQPLRYYDNNLQSTLVLLETMRAHGVQTLVFSSSATVYGDPATVPITEAFPLTATNPYGRTKLMIEEMLRDLAAAEPSWRIALLRYFNPVGAHPSGSIGEDPNGIPNNLMPFISQVAVGRRPTLSVFGGDYPTPDGTGVRDYIHVLDLVAGHARALEYLGAHVGLHVWNLGTGRGYSVLEVVEAFARVTGRPVPYRIIERRPGDVAACYADATKAARELGWRAERDLTAMCRDAWRWQQANPNGYSEQAVG